MYGDDSQTTGDATATGDESRVERGRRALGLADGARLGRSITLALAGLAALALIAGAAGPAAAQFGGSDGGSGGWLGAGSADGSAGDSGSGSWWGAGSSSGDSGTTGSGWWGTSGGDGGDAGTGGSGAETGTAGSGSDAGTGDSGVDSGTGWTGTGGVGGDQGVNRSELEQLVHERVNEARAENGLGPLSFDDGLREVARYHSRDMAENNYFSHTSPDGGTMTDRYDRFGYECRIPLGEYRYATGAENIFMYGSSAPSEEELAQMVVDGWMDSEGHRANIVDENHRRQGIGVAVSDDGSVYVTQNFC